LIDVYCYAEDVPEVLPCKLHSIITYTNNLYSKRLHVSTSSVEKYKLAFYWSDFGNIVALTDDDPKPTGIHLIESTEKYPTTVYNLNGQYISQPKKGLNILKKNDGTIKKVIVR
jgi:hypothetical protein